MSMLSEIRCPLVLAGAGPRTEAQTQLIVYSLVGSHKFKPKSQYNISSASSSAPVYGHTSAASPALDISASVAFS